MPILEIATFSVEAARIAQNAGAHRLELCNNYALGGITPTPSELEDISSFLAVPATVMIRPRGGNFVYNTKEISVLFYQINLVKSMHFQGIVLGVLTQENEIDLSLLKELVAAADGMDITFHRAFDEIQDLENAIAILKEAKINRILSGAWKNYGINYAQKLNTLAGENLVYMPGGGIRSHNLLHFLQAGFSEIHSAAITDEKNMPNKIEISTLIKTIEKYA